MSSIFKALIPAPPIDRYKFASVTTTHVCNDGNGDLDGWTYEAREKVREGARAAASAERFRRGR